MALDFIGKKATSLRNRIVDKVWERRLGIRTCGNVQIYQPDANLYGTFAYAWVMRMLGNMDWKADDVFVDIGSGKGRICCCCAAMFQARKVVGIDLDADLCRQARLNAKRLRGGRTPIEIVHARAELFDYSECTKFYMFHPFGAKTTGKVVKAIEASLASNPRSIQIAYANPVNESILERADGFYQYDYWRKNTWSGLKHDVAFWTWGRMGD